MIKILHSADWHLDSPIQGRTPEQTALLKQQLLQLPQKITAIAKAEGCRLMLLAGDIFDGSASAESIAAVKTALEDVQIPVFIAPGNHDFVSLQSPWLTEQWPANVHIFTEPVIQSVDLPALNCRVYGAGFTSMDAPALLDGFRAEEGVLSLGVLHGDPTQTASPYCPITGEQLRACGLTYLALGHIHKGDQLRPGSTLCAWPGCPMGRGYDEQGEKGVLVVTVEDAASARFIPLDTPRFYDLACPVDGDAQAALSRLLPAAGGQDFYRITLTGECSAPDLGALAQAFSHFPNLTLRDSTVPPPDLWASMGTDSLEGVYFSLLHDALEGADEENCRQIQLAARISRQLLEGREVQLP